MVQIFIQNSALNAFPFYTAEIEGTSAVTSRPTLRQHITYTIRCRCRLLSRVAFGGMSSYRCPSENVGMSQCANSDTDSRGCVRAERDEVRWNSHVRGRVCASHRRCSRLITAWLIVTNFLVVTSFPLLLFPASSHGYMYFDIYLCSQLLIAGYRKLPSHRASPS